MARRKKPSFFDRLTGAVAVEDDYESYDHFEENYEEDGRDLPIQYDEEESEEIEYESDDIVLPIEMYQTNDEIVVKASVAGMRPEDLDISITRESVVISGHKEGVKNVQHGDYFLRELEWGSFSRTIALPVEIEVEEAEAIEKHGLLIIKLPKIDKNRETKLKVKSH